LKKPVCQLTFYCQGWWNLRSRAGLWQCPAATYVPSGLLVI